MYPLWVSQLFVSPEQMVSYYSNLMAISVASSSSVALTAITHCASSRSAKSARRSFCAMYVVQRSGIADAP